MEATTFYAINETRDCHGKRCWLFDVWGAQATCMLLTLKGLRRCVRNWRERGAKRSNVSPVATSIAANPWVLVDGTAARNR